MKKYMDISKNIAIDNDMTQKERYRTTPKKKRTAFTSNSFPNYILKYSLKNPAVSSGGISGASMSSSAYVLIVTTCLNPSVL